MSPLDRFNQPVDQQQQIAGLEYYRAGMVQITKTAPGALSATVKAPQGPYRTLLMWDKSPGMDFTCTCAMGRRHRICAHLVATVLTADEQQLFAADRAKETLPRRGAHRPMMWLSAKGELRRADVDEPRPSVEHQPSLPTWQKQLARLKQSSSSSSETVSWPADRQVIYLIDLAEGTERNSLVIRLACRDRKHSGEWSRPKNRGVSFPEVGLLSDPDDRRIIAMLKGVTHTHHQSYDPVYNVPAPMRPMIVEQICRTGRAMLLPDSVDEPTQLTWDEAPPWQLVLEARRDESTQHYLFSACLLRDEQRMPVSRPLLLLEGGVVFYADKAAAVEDRGHLAWMTVLRQNHQLAVPFAQIDQFLAELLAMPNLPKLELPDDLRIENVRTAPRPVLRVRAAKPEENRPQRLRAQLSFEYGGVRVQLDRQASHTLFQPQGRRLIIRDQKAERDALSRLLRAGVRENLDYSSDNREFWFNQKNLPRLVRMLVNEGWLVEADGKLYRRAGAMRLHVGSGIDWFELTGEIDFEGHSLKLPELLKALRRGENAVQLDDGTLGVLPEDWLRKYGLIAAMGQNDSDAGFIKFARSQAALLDAIVSSDENATFDQTFARVREQLQHFSGVRPQDPPRTFVGELRPYQRDGLGWFEFLRQFGFGGCLADDMGLGKTVQVLALLDQRRALRESAVENRQSSIESPSLVVVPKSLVFNWIAEAARFTPRLRILDHTGIERARHGQPLMDYDVVITTYGTLRRDVEFLKDIQFDYVVLDEAQAVKNPASESAKAVRTIQGNHRLALSGTPVQNHLGDLWSVFDFLNPRMLGSTAIFSDSQSSLRHPEPAAREILAKGLRPFILRRTKEQVAGDLPPRLEQTIYCELDESQRSLYDELREYYRVSLLQRIEREGINKSKMHILEALLRLRQAAIHPGLIDPSRTGESSAKLDVLLPQLQEVIEEGHKALVFSQFTSMLSILRRQLDEQTITYEYLDGKTRDRATHVQHFQNDDACKLFLISLKAGGLGLNLTAADYVFLIDPWWNPAIEQQAIDRTHRIGQTKRVYACRLIAKDTVEEKVLALQQSKRQLADAIITADNSLIRTIAREDLQSCAILYALRMAHIMHV